MVDTAGIHRRETQASFAGDVGLEPALMHKLSAVQSWGLGFRLLFSFFICLFAGRKHYSLKYFNDQQNAMDLRIVPWDKDRQYIFT